MKKGFINELGIILSIILSVFSLNRFYKAMFKTNNTSSRVVPLPPPLIKENVFDILKVNNNKKLSNRIIEQQYTDILDFFRVNKKYFENNPDKFQEYFDVNKNVKVTSGNLIKILEKRLIFQKNEKKKIEESLQNLKNLQQVKNVISPNKLFRIPDIKKSLIREKLNSKNRQNHPLEQKYIDRELHLEYSKKLYKSYKTEYDNILNRHNNAVEFIKNYSHLYGKGNNKTDIQISLAKQDIVHNIDTLVTPQQLLITLIENEALLEKKIVVPYINEELLKKSGLILKQEPFLNTPLKANEINKPFPYIYTSTHNNINNILTLPGGKDIYLYIEKHLQNKNNVNDILRNVKNRTIHEIIKMLQSEVYPNNLLKVLINEKDIITKNINNAIKVLTIDELIHYLKQRDTKFIKTLEENKIDVDEFIKNLPKEDMIKLILQNNPELNKQIFNEVLKTLQQLLEEKKIQKPLKTFPKNKSTPPLPKTRKNKPLPPPPPREDVVIKSNTSRQNSIPPPQKPVKFKSFNSVSPKTKKNSNDIIHSLMNELNEM